MRSSSCCVIAGLLVLHSLALGAVGKSIFDDDEPSRATPPESAPSATNPTPAPGTGTKPEASPATPATVPDSTNPAPAPDSAVVSHSPRLAVPSPAAQADAWKLIKTDLYKDDIARARTPAQKVDLARKLLAVSEASNKDVVGKYVLLAQAKELAIGSGDPPTAFKCLDELGEAFDIDYPAMKLELFNALSRTVATPADIEEVAVGLNHWADGQIKRGRFDTAQKACEIALTVARKDRDPSIANQTLLHKKQIVAIESAYVTAKPSIATLATKPNDPAANLAVGRYYCFMKGDWSIGLPNLARGNDERLKALATKELAREAGNAAEMVIADGWWEIMEKEGGLPQERIRDHAAALYGELLPGLDGLAKAKVEKRLKMAKGQGSGGFANVLPLTLLDPLGNKVVGEISLKDDARATTEQKFAPPVEFTVVYLTRSTSGNDVRISYAADQIIFDWERNSNELRVDGGPANGHHMGGFGSIPANRWVEVKLQVLPEAMNIFVDGKQRYHTEADFSNVDQVFGIRAAGGSNVTIRSITARRPQP